MNLSRRDLIKFSLLAGAGSVLGANFPFAALALPGDPSPSPDQFLLMISIFGGMDVTLGLDPWTKEKRPDENDMFVEYRHDELIRRGQVTLGPAAKSLARHAADLAVLNGVMVSKADNGHPAAFSYMNTGNGQSNAPDLPIEIALATSSGPYGVITDSSLFIANRVISQCRTADLLLASQAPDASPAVSQLPTENLHSRLAGSINEVVRSKETTAELNQAIRKLRPDANKNKIEDFKLVAAAFEVGASRHAKLQLYAGDLDTHTNHPRQHLRIQTEIWTQVAAIFDHFKAIPYKGKTLFDATSFVVISEFSRTPFLNPSQGKDHNPLTNSVLFAGRGFKGGAVTGASTLVSRTQSSNRLAYHMALPIHYKEGRVAENSENAEFIFPENVAMTLAKVMGAKAPKFSSVPAQTKSLDAILSEPG